MRYFYRILVAPVMALAALGLLLGALTAAAPARAATSDAAQQCFTTGSVLLYSDPSMTKLVDYFSFNQAPTRHIFKLDSVSSYVIQAANQPPGAAVTGVITGTAYTFQFRLVSSSQVNNQGSTGHAFADWRVTAQGQGIISDSFNHSVTIQVADGHTVTKFFGPTEHGLTLSGFLGTSCGPS